MSIVEPPQPVRGANYITIAFCIVTYLERPRSYAVLLPDGEDVAKQSQGHPGVGRALMLEKAVEQDGVLVDLHGVEQVGLAAAQHLVGVGAGL